VNLYRVRSDALIGQYMGNTATNMVETMRWLSLAGQSVVLFDEIETLFESRETTSGTLARELSSAMAAMWQMLDRWTTPQIFCFATNLPDKLDKAMISRFELSLQFGPPNADQIRSVVEYWSEVFHEYGAESWGPELSNQPFDSFRDLWQAISFRVRSFALT